MLLLQDLPKMAPSRSHVTLGELLPGAVVSMTPALDNPLPYILQLPCSVGVKDSIGKPRSPRGYNLRVALQ
jgi:hypothetical protein